MLKTAKMAITPIDIDIFEVIKRKQTGREAIMPQQTLKIAKMAITQISRVSIFLLVQTDGGK